LPLEIHRIDRDDIPRSGGSGALDGVAPDATHAQHGHGVTSPGRTFAVFTTLPNPVGTQHSSRSKLPNGLPRSTLTTEAIGTTVYSEKAPRRHIWPMPSPRA